MEQRNRKKKEKMNTYTEKALLEKLFFNIFIDEDTRKEIEGLYLEVWNRIEKVAGRGIVTEIYGNLEFVIYKGIVELTGIGIGGSTGKSSYQCFVIYFPECKLGEISREGKLFVLAHEFAHVWYKHPKGIAPELKERQENDRKASEKAVEWGFKEDRCK